jgi:hypothetical protein
LLPTGLITIIEADSGTSFEECSSCCEADDACADNGYARWR